ncbi:hypothetical protein KNO81_41275 [Paraburkholderia sediminicola]|nr:hypothetical protein [Paraburkholderia sediminicola]
MKHHFSDVLDRSGEYWTITSNRERWSCHFSDLAEAPEDISKLTITRNDKNWQRAIGFEQLVELTLHEPDQSQLAALAGFPKLTALRISHARPKTLAMLEGQTALRELVLEYVSGVSDLHPVGRLPSLTALHMENLRRVSDFSPLGASKSLRYIAIYGTLDWSQPVESFDFLGGMERLEYLHLGFGVRVPDKSRLFVSLLELKKLSRLHIGMGTLPLDEFAWLEAMLPHVEGAVRLAFVRYGGEDRKLNAQDYRAKLPMSEFQRFSGLYVGADGKRYERVPHQAMLLGKGQRNVSGTDERVTKKCLVHEEKYQELVKLYRDA